MTILSSDDGKIVKEDKVPLGRNSLMYEVEPSKYLIRAKLDGYTDAEGSCDVGRGKPCTVRVKPVLKTYDVTLKLNIDGGTVIYRREDGLSISNSQQEVQGKSVTLHNLRPGKYTVTVKADDATYRPKIETIDVTDRNTNFTLSLERQVSGPFAWSVSSDWKLPASWHTDANRIISGGQGVALPSRDDYHYYLDFQLSTKVRMADGVAVSFIVHAVDLNNFYLVQLTGPKGEVPYRLRGFIVKDGVYQPFGLVINIEQFSQSLKPDSFFDVLLTMKDNKISVKLPDPETGEGLLPAGDLLDQSRTFPKGAVGVAVLNNERIEIGQFDICAANCQ